MRIERTWVQRHFLIPVFAFVLGATTALGGFAQASVNAFASNAGQVIQSARSGAVAGATASASGTSAYTLPSLTNSCSYSASTATSTPNNSTTIKFAHNSITNFSVGMDLSGSTKIAAGTKITGITLATPNDTVTFTPGVTGIISTGTSITAAGCSQGFFYVHNNQLINLHSFGISQSVLPANIGTVIIQSCSLVWNTVTGSCSGVISTVVPATTATSSISTAVLPLVGNSGNVQLRALASTSGIAPTISIAVRGNIDFVPNGVSNS